MWRDYAPDDVVYRRAGGRRRYNAVRQANADRRRLRLVEMMAAYSAAGGNIYDRGVRKRWAEALGVHKSTITRDIHRLLRRG